ncbi:hypothetical protein GEMRC1_008886 [Eukaryota sp. GEM-RC1]
MIIVFSVILFNIIVAVFVNSFLEYRALGHATHQSIQIDFDPTAEVKVIELLFVDEADDKLSKSLFIFEADSKFRKFTHRLVNRPSFSFTSYFLIFVSCFLIVIEADNSYHDGRFYSFVPITMMLFFYVVASTAFGKGGVFRSFSTGFDAAIILISSIDLFLPSDSFFARHLSVIFIFRAFRPLRLLYFFKPGKVVLASISSSLPSILSGFFIFALFLFVFSVVGHLILPFSVLPTLTSPLSPVKFGFRNSIEGFLTLFTFSTGSGFGPIVRDYAISSPLTLIYLVCFVVFGIWISYSIFISIMADVFAESAVGIRESVGETEEIRRSRMIIKTLQDSVCVLHCKPGPNTSKYRRMCFNIVHTKSFEFFISILIYTNTIVLSLYSADMTEGRAAVFKIILNTITICFAFEIVLRHSAYGTVFWHDFWHIYDVIIVGATLPAFFLKSEAGTTVVVLRLLRAAKAIRLSQLLHSIRKLFRTTVIAFPVLFGIFSLATIVFFIFSVLGMRLFADVTPDVIEGGINSTLLNFSSFPRSLFSLLVLSSAQKWQQFMASSAICTSGCSAINSILFFSSFVFLFKFVLFNLIVAAIIDSFVTAFNDLKAIVNPADVHIFVEQWFKYENNCVGFLKLSNLPELFENLKPPISVGKSKRMVDKILFNLNVPVYYLDSDDCSFYVCLFDVLPEVFYRLLHPSVLERLRSVRRSVNSKCKVRRQLLMQQNRFSTTELTVQQIFAVKTIMKHWRLSKTRRANRELSEGFCSQEMSFIGSIVGQL